MHHSELGMLSKLTVFSAWINRLSGIIPEGRFSNFIMFTVFFITLMFELCDVILSEIGNLTSLTFLDLGDNRLTSTIPSGGLISASRFEFKVISQFQLLFFLFQSSETFYD